MAQIDSSIALGVRPPQFESPMNQLAQMMQVQGMKQQGEMNRLKMDEYQQGLDRSNRLRSLLGQDYDGPESRESALLKGGFADEAMKFGKDRRDNAKADADVKKAQLESHLKKFEVVGQIMSGVRDQGSWDMARQQTAQMFGPEAAANLPPQYDPQFVEMNRVKAMSVKDQMEQQYKALTQAETVRHNGATEGIQGGQLRVAQGNLRLRTDELEAARGNLVAEAGGPSQLGLVKKFGKPEKGYRWKEDGSQEAIPGGSAAMGKALPTKLITDLTEQAGTADTTERLRGTFQDQYAGKTILGDWSNTFKRVAGDDTGQSQWWQDYALHESTIRNKLFGASLTPGEQAQWQRLTVSPRMNADEARQNLQRRADIEKRGLDRLMNSSAKAGYNKEQIEALTGRTIGQSAAPTSPSSNIDSLLDKYK